MKDFCIITNPCKDKDYCLTKEMKSLIELKGGSCQVIREGEEIPASAEGIFVLGGDQETSCGVFRSGLGKLS